MQLLKKKKSSGYQFKTLPRTYTEYLEEHEILNDVKDILEAYDLQVENSVFELTNHIACTFENLINMTRPKLININEGMCDFKEVINKLAFKMQDEVTRIQYGETTEVGYNEWEREKVEERYGALSTFFPQEVQESIQSSKKNIFPIINNLENTSLELNAYENSLYNLKNDLNFAIEKAVYDSQELSTIIEIQKLIGGKIEVMLSELKNVQYTLEETFEGKSISAYQAQIGEVICLLTYFNAMSEDCFWGNI
ncbi:MAG: hypothetical protein ACRCWM_02665 [Sarcina sp.]